MKCENCGKNEVNFVFHSSINGKTEEKHLCHDCAEQLGYTKKLQQSYADMNSLFRRSLAPMGLLSGGSAFLRGGLWDDGFFGGSLLGDGFFDDFFAMPRLMGAPAQAEPAQEEQKNDLVSQEEQKELCRQREINALRAEMKQAVDSENFERAAQLRDQIRAKEQEQ